MSDERRVLYLLCLQGKERGRRFAVNPGQELAMGRDPGEPGLAISDLLASRHHAQLVVHEASITVTDCGSANGTRINGRPLDEPGVLLNGDILTIGHSSFVLEDPRVQSSGEHVSDSTRTHRRRQSQRLKRQLEQHKTVAMEPIGDRGGGAPESVLTELLATLPLGLLLIDQGERVLMANDLLRQLVAVEVSPGQAAAPVLAALADCLSFPEDLETVISSDDDRPMRMELADGRFWVVWSQRRQALHSIFVLPGESF
ncbi:MAG: FHA domain-containing protein [Planctomycetota bacterium]